MVGQAQLFKQIWDKRLHESYISETFLGDEMKAQFFAHVIPKGSYPKFKLYEKNIVLLTFEEHILWDHQRDKIRANKIWLKKWEKLFLLEEKLKTEYYHE